MDLTAGIFDKVMGAIIIAVILGGLILRARYPKIPIWTIMSLAAFLTIVTGLVGPDYVESSINWDVILFLIGMFSLATLAYESGLLEYLALRLLGRAGSPRAAVYVLLLTYGLMAAFVVNDAVAAMGSLIIIPMARAAGIDPELAVLILAFSVTIGSTMTPIGNPQNMLIAVESGVREPLTNFLLFLGPPTVINLVLTGALLNRLYKVKSARKPMPYRAVPEEAIKSRKDATIAGGALLGVIAVLAVNDVYELYGRPPLVADIGVIPFTAAALAYILSSKPREVIREVNWSTILFFMVMFIAMSGVWKSGVLNPLLRASLPGLLTGFEGVLRVTVASLAFSQVLSNVPFTQLFLTYMKALGYSASATAIWVALAMATTIAGNLTILGAASNVIILESVESRYGVRVSYTKFMKVGVLVTLLNVAVYLAYMIPLAMLLRA